MCGLWCKWVVGRVVWMGEVCVGWCEWVVGFVGWFGEVCGGGVCEFLVLLGDWVGGCVRWWVGGLWCEWLVGPVGGWKSDCIRYVGG